MPSIQRHACRQRTRADRKCGLAPDRAAGDAARVKLFHRIKKRNTLTRAGTAYSTRVAQTIERIERDTLEIMGYDGALYFGEPDWPRTQADYLFDEVLLPVGSPRLIGKRAELRPSEVAVLRLLHLVSRPDAWRRWFDAAELGGTNAIPGPRFDIQSTLISAANSGLGIALLPECLISDQLTSGKLKVLSNLTLRSVGSYYFACQEEKAENPLLSAFRAWLLTQAGMSAPPALRTAGG